MRRVTPRVESATPDTMNTSSSWSALHSESILQFVLQDEAAAVMTAFVMMALATAWTLGGESADAKNGQRRWNGPETYRRGILFSCVSVVLAWASGLLEILLFTKPYYEATHGFAICVGVVATYLVVAYCMWWSAKTHHFDRSLRILPALSLSFIWTLVNPLNLLNIVHTVARVSGWLEPGTGRWAPVLYYLVAYLAAGLYIPPFQSYFWAPMMPAHDSSKFFGKKVFFCHIPNFTISLLFLTLYPKAVHLYLGLEFFVLFTSCLSLRAPACWDRGRVHIPTTTIRTKKGYVKAAPCSDEELANLAARGIDTRPNQERCRAPFFMLRHDESILKDVHFF